MVSVKEGIVGGAGAAARLACAARGRLWPSSFSQAPPPSCPDSATSRPGLQTHIQATSPGQHRTQNPVGNNALLSQVSLRNLGIQIRLLSLVDGEAC